MIFKANNLKQFVCVYTLSDWVWLCEGKEQACKQQDLIFFVGLLICLQYKKKVSLKFM